MPAVGCNVAAVWAAAMVGEVAESRAVQAMREILAWRGASERHAYEPKYLCVRVLLQRITHLDFASTRLGQPTLTPYGKALRSFCNLPIALRL